MANTYLYRTQVAGTSTQKMTFSAWVKKAETGSYFGLLNCYTGDANRNGIYFANNDRLNVYFRTGGSTHIYYETTREFKDPNAWYHIVVRIDTTQGNASHRCRIYINGEEETSYTSSSGGSQNANFSVIGTNNLDLEVGRMQYGSTVTAYFSGVMSHVHFLDGEDRTPDFFGETDATTGEWRIKTDVTGVTYGNNGFFILKNDNSNLDRSGEGHNQTIGGTLTKTEDNPSNVFCTWNPLNMTNSNMAFLNGNTALSSSVAWLGQIGTLAMSSGKYYWEIKYGGGNVGYGVGTWGKASTNTNDLSNSNYGYVGKYPGGYELFQNSGQPYKLNNSNNNGNYGSEASSGDIIMVAFDADNNKLFTGINGTWNNSSDPANGTNPMYTVTSGELYAPSCSIENGSLSTNFGNGFYGTTAVSSAGTNASNNGIFEYDVPSGFTALSTKGLNL